MRKLGVPSERAFLDYRVHPLGFRRDVAMLGVLYKCAHRSAHPSLQVLFPLAPVSSQGRLTRRASHEHALQLLLRHHGSQRMEFHRSLFGLVKICNALPTWVAMRPSINSFQKALVKMARIACENGEGWDTMLSPPLVSPVLLRFTS